MTSPAQELAAWLYERPRIRRAWMGLCVVWCGVSWAVMAAPGAVAQGVGDAVSWTGLHDSYGVPATRYFVSFVSLATQIKNDGHPLTLNPLSWGSDNDPKSQLVEALHTVLHYMAYTYVLSGLCCFLILMCATGIWFVKFSLSAQWLGWLAALAGPFVTALHDAVKQLYVVPIALLVCCLFGGVIALTRGRGHGIGVILSGFLIILLVSVLMKDPANDVLSEHGLLGIGRSLGFAVSQAAAHNGSMGANNAAQVDTLGTWLCDVLLRMQIQEGNFGMVIDDVPGCGQAWSQAIMGSEEDGPVNAMKACGATQAYTNAISLGFGQGAWFVVVILVEFVVLFALAYMAFEVFRIGFSAFVDVMLIVPVAALAVAPGAPRRFAARVLRKLVVDGVEMLAATAGFGIVTIIMGEVTRGSVPGMWGMNHPFARLMIMTVVALAGAVAFRRLLTEFHYGPGLLARTYTRIWETGRAWGYNDYLFAKMRGMPLFGGSNISPGSDTHNWREWRAARRAGRKAGPSGSSPSSMQTQQAGPPGRPAHTGGKQGPSGPSRAQGSHGPQGPTGPGVGASTAVNLARGGAASLANPGPRAERAARPGQPDPGVGQAREQSGRNQPSGAAPDRPGLMTWVPREVDRSAGPNGGSSGPANPPRNPPPGR